MKRDTYRELRQKNLDAFHAAVQSATTIGLNHNLSLAVITAIEKAMVELLLTFI